jgi:hypothetical protein
MTAYSVDPSVVLYDVTGSLFGTRDNPIQTTITSPNSNTNAIVIPRGNLNVMLPGTTVFSDKFDGFYVNTDNWSLKTMNGGSATVITGTMILQSLPQIYSLSQLTSNFTIASKANAALHFSSVINVSKFTSGTHYFWGFGDISANTTKYMNNGVGFELDASGSYNAVIYFNTNKIFSAPINSHVVPGIYNTYRMFIYNDAVYFYGNSLSSPIASIDINDWSVVSLPVMFHVYTDATVTVDSGVMGINSVAIADLGRNNTTISDGTNQWQTAKVDKYGSQQFSPVDQEGQSIITNDGASLMNVRDEELLCVMQSILEELKKMNMHMSMVTNVQIKTSDLLD